MVCAAGNWQKGGVMKVQLEKGVWLADCEGDPGRTTKEENAKGFDKVYEAVTALEKARTFRPFEKAEIQGDFFKRRR